MTAADLATAADVQALAVEVRELRAEVAALREASPPRLVSVAEAARMTGVSPRSIWRRVADTTIPCVRIGRSVRIDVRELAALAREARG